MIRHAWLAIFAASAAAMPCAASAQSPDESQALGQRLFVQSCGVCHLKPQLTAPQFAPVLSKESLGGQEDVMRQVIANGTPRMPGFRHHFAPREIDAIVAYIKTVPASQAAPTPQPTQAR